MNYKVLRSQFIRLAPQQELLFDAGEGCILIPQDNAKIYLHWLNNNGKMVSTLTLTMPTVVYNSVKIINSSSSPACIRAISL